MAVHNEHSFRSFPSFCEAEHYDDDNGDDSDNNFVICLDDIRDESEQKSNNTSFCRSVSPQKPHIIAQNQQTSTHMLMSCNLDVQNMYKVSNSTFSSSAYNRDFSSYPQLLTSNIKNKTQAELQPNVCNTPPGNQHGFYKQLPTVDVVPDLVCSTESNFRSRSNYPEKMAVAVSCSIGNSGATVSNNSAACMLEPNISLSETVSSHFMHSEHQTQELSDKNTHSIGSQEKLLKSPSEWPKMHLETIHLDKEAGGIWSEAVFLTSVATSDSFSSISNNPSEKVPFEGTDDRTPHMRHQLMASDISPSSSHTFSTVSCSSPICVPKLSGPYSKSSSPEIRAAYSGSFQPYPTPPNMSRGVSTQHPHENSTCTCIMCYKGSGIVECHPESDNEKAVLTEEEQLLILKGPVKRKRLRSTIESKKKKESLSFCNIETKFQQPSPFLDKFSPLQPKSILSDVGGSYNFVQKRNLLVKPSASLVIRSKYEVSAQETPLTAGCNEHKSTINSVQRENITPDVLGLKKPLMQCQRTTTTAASGVESVVVLSPNIPDLVNVPRFRSNPPTKVFLKPTEMSGPSTPELLSSNSGRESLVGAAVTCKESPHTSTSASSTHCSPPSYKIIYVNQDQVLVCPSKTTTSVSFMPVSQQPQPNIQYMTTLKLPQTNIQNKISVDSQQNTPNVNQTSHLCVKKGGSTNPNSLTPVHKINTVKDLKHVLKNAEKIDITRPGKIIIQFKSPPRTSGPKNGGVHNSHIVTNVAVIPVSKSSVHTSVLKDFKLPQAKVLETSAPAVHLSQACSVDASNMSAKAQPPVVTNSSSLEVAQTLMCRIKSQNEENKSIGTKNVLMKLIKGGLQTSESSVLYGALQSLNNSHQNSETSNLADHRTMTCEPLQDKQLLISKRDMHEETGISLNDDTVSNPYLPQEGLPTTYVQDWVNQTKSYVSEHLPERSCLPNAENMHPPVSFGTATDHHKAFSSSLTQNSELETHVETLSSPTLTANSASAQSPKHQIVPKPSSNPSSVHNFTDSSTNVCHMRTDRLLSQPSTTHTRGEQLVQPFSLQGTSETTISASVKPSHFHVIKKSCPQNVHISPQAGCESTVFSDLPKKITGHASGAAPLSSSSPSSVVDGSNGIKLKIKLSELRKKQVKYSQSCQSLETSITDCESPPHGSGEEFSLQKRLNVKGQEAVIGTGEGVIDKAVQGDRIETAEEMFQRFQEQAVQEVVKAQMGIGYLSRSLRPAKTTMALFDNYPGRFGTGTLKKKISEENVHIVSKNTAENQNCNVPEIEEQSCKHNAQNKQLNIRYKRHIEETSSKEIKMKQPKLSLKDYPRLEQDCSITNCKKLFCSNILAGHKVYVRFNTYENDCSGRVFLVPFFNIGGTRTQFDAEDMEYINKAVLEFEKEERSCARHLLFYVREGQKAAFLRKESHFQTSQIIEKNYRKCSFILEGFSRDTKKQAKPPPEEWTIDNKVDIEIDRAEIDNDVEIEFDADINCDPVVNAEEKSTSQSAAPDKVKDKEQQSMSTHDWNHQTHAETIISHDPVHHETTDSGQPNISNYDFPFSNVNAEYEVNTQIGINTAASSSKKLSDYIPYPGNPSTYTEELQAASEVLCGSTAGKKVVQVPLHNPSISTVTADNNEIQHSCVYSFNTEVKQEKVDDDYGSIISSRDDQYLDKCTVFVKQEPVDEYFDASVEMEPSSLHCSQTEQKEAESHTKVFQHHTHLSTTPSVQQKSVEEESAALSTKADLLQQQPETVVLNLPSSSAGVSQGQTAESSIGPTRRLASGLHIIGDSTSEETDIRNSKNVMVESLDESIDESPSIKTNSITGPSLPESPLPSSSVSGSSDISASSDVDEKLASSESECSDRSPITDLAAEDENVADKQNNVQNKIMSLVESLRSRLTQETPVLPPWLAGANTSVTDARFKRKKKFRKSTEKDHSHDRNKSTVIDQSQDSILPAEVQLSDTVFSSEVKVSTTLAVTRNSDQMQSSSSTSLLPISVVPSLSTDSISLTTNCTPSLPVDILQSFVAPIDTINSSAHHSENIFNRNPMLLPVKQPTEKQMPLMRYSSVSQVCCTNGGDISSVAASTLNEKVSKVIFCERESLLKHGDSVCEDSHASQNETLSGESVDKCTPQFAIESRRVNTFNSCEDTFKAASSHTEYLICSEDMNSNRQSPIDFEIEVGDEDLPETALMLQPILPNEHLCLEALQMNRGRITEYDISSQLPHLYTPDDVAPLQQHTGKESAQSILQHANQSSTRGQFSLSRLGADRTKQKEEKKLHINLKDNHSQVVKESKKPNKSSVANYLCQKFLFSGAGHKIQGPRLLHMPASRKAGFKEAKKQKIQIQTIHNNIKPPETITAVELSKTPSVTEIFGGTVRPTLNPDMKIESVEIDNLLVPKSQKTANANICQAQVSKKRTANRKSRKNARDMLSDSRAVSIKPIPDVSAAAVKHKHNLSQKVPNTELTSETVSSMQLCRVVLTRLENLDMCDIDRLSDHVFVIKQEPTEMKETPEPNRTDAGSLSACSSRSTLRKLVKKKKKKTLKGVKKPKRDIVDYYAFMLETLRKKAQLLEEETQRKSEECAKKLLRENTNEKFTSSDETNDNCESLKEKMIHKETEKMQELCHMTGDIDCSLKCAVDSNVTDCAGGAASLDALINADDKDGQMACDGSLLKSPKEMCMDVVLSDDLTVGTSSVWPYLQKFCDETIFTHSNAACLQKMTDGANFANMNVTSVSELKFEKKDVVLSSSVADDTGTLGSSQALMDTECGLEGCSPDQERDNVDEDEILLGLDIQKSSSFSLHDPEMIRNPFSLGVTSSLTDNQMFTAKSEKTVQTNCKYENISEHELSHSEPSDSTIIVSCAPHSCTSTAQSLTSQTISVRKVEVSPSWERLLGYKSLDVSNQSADGSMNTDQDKPNNHDVSFIASSDFKFKFRLPKGVLSKAVEMSRGMKQMFEEPVSENSPLSNDNSIVEDVNYTAHPQNGENESTTKEDSLIPTAAQTMTNVNVSSKSKLKIPELSPVTLIAIQKAKTEFLQRRKRGAKSKLKHQSKTVLCESDKHSILDRDLTVGTTSALPQEPSDSSQMAQSDVRSGACSVNVRRDINLTEEKPACSKYGSLDSTGLTQANEGSAMQAKDLNFHDSIFNVGKTVTGTCTELPNVSVKQCRKDGIFSNIDLFQGCGDDYTTKQACNPPSNKEAALDTVLKSSVFDISKLKLKLTSLVSSTLKERSALTNMDSLLYQEASTSEVKNDGCDNLQVAIQSKSEELLHLQVRASNSPDVLNGVGTSECTSGSEQQFAILQTSKPISQVNAAKLCSILKNFHKNANMSSTMPAAPDSMLPGVTGGHNNRDRTIESSISSHSFLHPVDKSKKLDTLSGTSEKGKNVKGKTRGQKRLKTLPQTGECKMQGGRLKANKLIVTGSSVTVPLPVKLSYGPEENMCSSETLKSDEKGVRSFFDCLSSVPLDTWEDK